MQSIAYRRIRLLNTENNYAVQTTYYRRIKNKLRTSIVSRGTFSRALLTLRVAYTACSTVSRKYTNFYGGELFGGLLLDLVKKT